MQTQQSPESMPVHRLQITLRTRILVIMTVMFTVFFAGLYTWVYGEIARALTHDFIGVPAFTPDIQNTLIGSIHSHMEAIAPFVFGASYLFFFSTFFAISYGVGRPLRSLTRFAHQVANGDYTPIKLVPTLFGRDEISVLGEVLVMMVDKVREREASLKQQVHQLQIAVNAHRRDQELSEIVETDFFAHLKDQAKDLRAKRQSDTPVHDT